MRPGRGSRRGKNKKNLKPKSKKSTKRKSFVTRGWLKGLVDAETFPNVHPSYTREEALDQPSQVMLPPDYFQSDSD
jgi:hypothetical protein